MLYWPSLFLQDGWILASFMCFFVFMDLDFVKCTLRPHPLCECPRVTALQVAKIPRLGNNDSAKKFEKLLLLNPITIGHERNVGDLFVTVLWTGFVSSLFNWQGMVSKWRLLLERSCRKWRLVRKYPTMCCLLGCPGSQALEEVNLHYRTLLTAFFLLECVNWTDFRHSSKKPFYFF